jgi:hypothetical protein
VTLDLILGGLGILLSLPAFFLLFFNGYQTAAILTLLLGVVVIVAAFVVYYLETLPAYTIKAAKVELTFPNNTRDLARLAKEFDIRPNHNHLASMTHKNIAADGVIKNFQWDGVPIPDYQIKKENGQYEVTIHFIGGPRRRFSQFKGTLSYELENSFASSTENLGYVIDFPTHQVEIDIRLPLVCRDPLAFHVTGGGRTEIDPPKVENGGKQLGLSIRRPRPLASEYRIYWTW